MQEHRHGKAGLITLSKVEKNLSVICHKGRQVIFLLRIKPKQNWQNLRQRIKYLRVYK